MGHMPNPSTFYAYASCLVMWLLQLNLFHVSGSVNSHFGKVVTKYSILVAGSRGEAFLRYPRCLGKIKALRFWNFSLVLSQRWRLHNFNGPTRGRASVQLAYSSLSARFLWCCGGGGAEDCPCSWWLRYCHASCGNSWNIFGTPIYISLTPAQMFFLRF